MVLTFQETNNSKMIKHRWMLFYLKKVQLFKDEYLKICYNKTGEKNG